MTTTPDHSDSTPQPSPLFQFAQPKLILPGVTKGRKPKLNWSDNSHAIDLLAERTLKSADEFFNS
jgi:hypothetical protein